MTGSEISLINLPALLIGSLLIAAMVTYVLRSWETFTAVGAALFTAGWALWLWNVDLSAPIRDLPLIGRSVDLTAPLARFGFTLQLQPGAIPIVTASLALAAVAFLLTARISQGHSFVPFSLALLAGYVFLALVTAGPLAPSLLAPLFLIGLTCMGIFVLQAGRPINPGGPLRLLIPPVLAFPLFLVAAWYIEQIPLNPQETTVVVTAARLLALGLLLLLAPVPLHSALPATAQSAPPVVTSLLTLLYQLALLHLLYRVVSTFPFVAEQTLLGTWLTLAGLVTAIWGGIAAAGASHPGRLWGYAALHDWGLIIMVLAVPGVRSWPLVLFLFSLRAVSMLTAATGLSALERHTEGFDEEKVPGIGMRTPWNSAAYLLGGLGLTGFPLSAGFTGHWAALQIVAETDWRLAAAVLIASGGAIFGFIRMARILFGPALAPQYLRERPISAVMALIAILLSASLALAPQLMDGPISRALVAFSG
jgi:hypothetical protein